MRVSPVAAFRVASTIYIEIARNTPLTLVFFFTAFVLPRVGLTLDFLVGAVAALNSEFAREGIAPLAIGIGINTGHCIVGNMGSGARFDYSAIGDAVNLAARLEGMTKDMGVP